MWRRGIGWVWVRLFRLVRGPRRVAVCAALEREIGPPHMHAGAQVGGVKSMVERADVAGLVLSEGI